MEKISTSKECKCFSFEFSLKIRSPSSNHFSYFENVFNWTKRFVVQQGLKAFLQERRRKLHLPLARQPEGSEPNVFNVVIEVSRWTNAKMEINLAEKLNPIFTRIQSDSDKVIIIYLINDCFILIQIMSMTSNW